MKGQQRIIVSWMQAQIERLRISPAAWAKRAGISPTTVTRAMSEDYPAVTSVPTLVALAEAGGIPTCLDFLASQTLGLGMPGAMRQVLVHILDGSGCTEDGRAEQISEAMIEALATLSLASIAAQNDALFVQSVAAAAVVRAGVEIR